MANAIPTSVPSWMVTNRHYWIELTRIVLGALMFNNGVYFVRNSGEMHRMLEQALPVDPFIVAHIVVVVFLAGGVLLMLGLLTRVAAAAQIPILLGAVFLVHGTDIFLGGANQPEYALLVLLLLIVFFFYGGGKWSMDHYVMRAKEEEE